MRFEPSKSKAHTALISPWERMQQTDRANKDTLTGPGIGVPRDTPGLGLRANPYKRQRPFAITKGDTPERDGPFANPAQSVATEFPPATRASKRRDKHGRIPLGGLNPFKTE